LRWWRGVACCVEFVMREQGRRKRGARARSHASLCFHLPAPPDLAADVTRVRRCDPALSLFSFLLRGEARCLIRFPLADSDRLDYLH
jgi:hypothetical protein